MSDDIAADVQRLRSIVERLPQLTEHARLLKQSHDGLRQEITEIAGNTSGFTQEIRGNLSFADKMVDGYVDWMNDIKEKLTEFAQRVEQAGMGGPFG